MPGSVLRHETVHGFAVTVGGDRSGPRLTPPRPARAHSNVVGLRHRHRPITDPIWYAPFGFRLAHDCRVWPLRRTEVVFNCGPPVGNAQPGWSEASR